MSWCVIAVEIYGPELVVLPGDSAAVGDGAGDGEVGVGKRAAAMSPAGQPLPLLVIGKSVFHRYTPGRVMVAGRSCAAWISGGQILFASAVV